MWKKLRDHTNILEFMIVLAFILIGAIVFLIFGLIVTSLMKSYEISLNSAVV